MESKPLEKQICAPVFCILMMSVNFLSHPTGFAAKISIISSGLDAYLNEASPYNWYGPTVVNITRAFSHILAKLVWSSASATIRGVESGALISSRTICSLSKLLPAMAHLGPSALLIMLVQVFCYKPTCIPGCSIDNNVKFAIRHICT